MQISFYCFNYKSKNLNYIETFSLDSDFYYFFDFIIEYYFVYEK